MANNRWSISRLMSGGSHQASSTPAPRPSTPSVSQPHSSQNRSSVTQSHATNPRHSYAAHRQTPQSSRAAASPTTPSSSGSRHTHSSGTRVSASSSQPSSSDYRASREQRYAFSHLSTGAVVDSTWYAEDFMLGAGMVILQPSSGKVVLLHEAEEIGGHTYHRWFLPKGRKDVGESLEQAALREAHEESGLRVSFLPLIVRHNAPEPPHSLDHNRMRPVSEPIFISTLAYGRGSGGRNQHGGEYLTFWYVGQIPADAAVETGTRMADEVGYETYLLAIDDALPRLNNQLAHIVQIAYELWLETLRTQADPGYRPYMAQLRQLEAQAAARPAAGVHMGGGAGDSGAVDMQMGSNTPAGGGGNDEQWEDVDEVIPPELPVERAAYTSGVGSGHSARSGRTHARAA